MSQSTPAGVVGPPIVVHDIKTEYLPLPDVAGKTPINLCSAFCVGEIQQKDCIILPPSLYPPQWDQRAVLTKMIKKSALENAGFELNQCRLDPVRMHLWLQCKKRLVYQDRTPTEDKENYQKTGENVAEKKDEGYKLGVKRSVIVDKNKSSRGAGGKQEKRRCQTAAAASKKDKCSFELKLSLVEDKHWCVPFQKIERCKHNHHIVDPLTHRAHMATMSQEQQEQAAFFSQVTGSSVSQKLTENMTGRMPPSRQQLHYNRKKVESGGNIVPKTQAQALIDHLKDKVKEKKMRYVALYHEVTETTLLATTKYEARAKAKNMNEARKDQGGTANEIDPDLKELEEAASLDFTSVDANGQAVHLSLTSATDKLGIA